MPGLALALTLAGCARSRPPDAPVYVACAADSKRHDDRAAELQRLANEDQADRRAADQRSDLELRDRARRERVAEIFGEGCLQTGDDFAAAALVYQHGGDLTVDATTGQPRAQAPDQIYQAWVWARRATDLGHDSRWLAAAALDRYLWYTGHRQLYGTQGGREGDCWCLVPTEPTFPDAARVAATGFDLDGALAHTTTFPGQGADCEPHVCGFDLQPTPPGSVPGLW